MLRITKELHVWSSKAGRNIAFITKDDDIYTARGFFGEEYGQGATPVEAVRAAKMDPRFGKIPRNAML